MADGVREPRERQGRGEAGARQGQDRGEAGRPGVDGRQGRPPAQQSGECEQVASSCPHILVFIANILNTHE